MKILPNEQIIQTDSDSNSDDRKKHRILIAEDSPTSCILLQKTIERWGHDVIVTRDGDEAWEALRTQNIRLAVLDRMMPGIDGTEVCRRVRAMNNERYTYLIMLTAKGRKEDIAEALQAGADDHLIKPFDRDELRAG